MSKRLDAWLHSYRHTDKPIVIEEFECESQTGDTMLVRAAGYSAVAFELFNVQRGSGTTTNLISVVFEREKLDDLITTLIFIRKQMKDD